MESPWQFGNNLYSNYLSKREKVISILDESFVKKWTLFVVSADSTISSFPNIEEDSAQEIGHFTDLDVLRLMLRKQAYTFINHSDFSEIDMAKAELEQIQKHFRKSINQPNLNPHWTIAKNSWELYRESYGNAKEFQSEYFEDFNSGQLIKTQENIHSYRLKPFQQHDSSFQQDYTQKMALKTLQKYDFELKIKDQLEEEEEEEDYFEY